MSLCAASSLHAWIRVSITGKSIPLLQGRDILSSSYDRVNLCWGARRLAEKQPIIHMACSAKFPSEGSQAMIVLPTRGAFVCLSHK